ncbi:hypothetical protein Tco_0741902 [Tanacetum coccineum]
MGRNTNREFTGCDIFFLFFVGIRDDAVTLLKRIQKFSMTQDLGARAAAHIFNMIGFAIAKGMWAQIVSRLLSILFNLECKSAIKRQRQEESIANAIRSWSVPCGLDLSERNVKQCKRKICDGHYTDAVKVISSTCVAPYSDATLEDLKAKHPFKPAPFLLHISIDHHHLIASPIVVLDRIKSFPCGGESLSRWELSKILGEYITSASLTQLVKPGGGIRPIAVGTVWRRGPLDIVYIKH